MSAKHSYALDERQARVLARAKADGDQLAAEAAGLRSQADAILRQAGEVLNDAVGVVLQAHQVDLGRVGEVALEDGKLVVTEATDGKPAALAPKAPPPAPSRPPAPVSLGAS